MLYFRSRIVFSDSMILHDLQRISVPWAVHFTSRRVSGYRVWGGRSQWTGCCSSPSPRFALFIWEEQVAHRAYWTVRDGSGTCYSFLSSTCLLSSRPAPVPGTEPPGTGMNSYSLCVSVQKLSPDQGPFCHAGQLGPSSLELDQVLPGFL